MNLFYNNSRAFCYSMANRHKGILSFYYLLSTIVFVFLINIPAKSNAQTLPVGDPFEHYQRILQLSDTTHSGPSFNIRPISNSQTTNQQSTIINHQSLRHPWHQNPFFDETPDQRINIYAPTFTTTYNSDFPSGQNDGPLWQGRDLNTAFSAGARFEYGPVELVLRPEFTHSSNHPFELAPDSVFVKHPYALSEYAQGLARIDSPQRFGDEPYSMLHAGQSYLRVSQWGAAAGISTANMWTGPAIQNPLTLSNNAPGFFHAFLETDGPLQTPAGKIESRLFWGGLQESGFFDEDEINNLRYISGLVFSYTPVFASNLHVGFSRTFVENYPEGGHSFSTLTRPFQPFTEKRFLQDHTVQLVNSNSPGTLKADKAIHMVSLFGRWVHPRSGFETWFEWGKNENSSDKRNLLRERVHTRSYVLGLMKQFGMPGSRLFTAGFEMTQLENTENIQNIHYPVWYEHPIVKQGFTHRGQVLGAGIGPGSNSQQLRVDFYDKWGLAGLSVNRIIHHNDRLYRHYDHIAKYQDFIYTQRGELRRVRLWKIHETEFRIGLHGLFFLPGNIEIELNAYRSSILNRYNIFENDELNTQLEFTLRYMIKGWSR